MSARVAYFNLYARYSEPVPFATRLPWADALAKIHPDAAVLWDRDMAGAVLPDDPYVQVVCDADTDLGGDKTIGWGDVTSFGWGDVTSYGRSAHRLYRFVTHPKHGTRWITCVDETNSTTDEFHLYYPSSVRMVRGQRWYDAVTAVSNDASTAAVDGPQYNAGDK